MQSRHIPCSASKLNADFGSRLLMFVIREEIASKKPTYGQLSYNGNDLRSETHGSHVPYQLNEGTHHRSWCIGGTDDRHPRAIRNDDEGSQRPRQEVRIESSKASNFGEGSRSDRGGSGRSLEGSSSAWEDRGRGSRPRKIDNVKGSYNIMNKTKDADPAPSQDKDVRKDSQIKDSSLR